MAGKRLGGYTHKMELMEMCKKHALFEQHSNSQLAHLIAKMVPLELNEGDPVFCKGDKGQDMFVLHSGELACMTNETIEVKVLRAGDCFGELAALGLSTERTITIQAKCRSVVYQVASTDFEESFSDRPEDYAKLQESMKGSALQGYHDRDKLKIKVPKFFSKMGSQVNSLRRRGVAALEKTVSSGGALRLHSHSLRHNLKRALTIVQNGLNTAQ